MEAKRKCHRVYSERLVPVCAIYILLCIYHYTFPLGSNAKNICGGGPTTPFMPKYRTNVRYIRNVSGTQCYTITWRRKVTVSLVGSMNRGATKTVALLWYQAVIMLVDLEAL